MYSIKVTHNGEVRRLQVPLDGIVNSAYEQLIQTVRNMFPDLYLNKSFCLTWQDDEGDTVTVSSEVELTEAIRVMTTMYGGNSLRFTVKKIEGSVKSASTASTVATPVTPSVFVQGGDRIAAAMKREAEEVIHYGVQCDECGASPLVGLRYKCTVRHNFDLCSVCFEKRTQPYPMIKIEDPQDKRGCRRGRGDRGDRGGKCRFEGPPAPHGHHGPPHHHHHGHRGGHPHHPHPHHGGGRGGRGGGGGLFHWFGGAPHEGIPYEGCEDYYGPFSPPHEGEEEVNEKGTTAATAATAATAEDKTAAAHHRFPFGHHHPPPPPPHPHGQHPPHGGLFGGRGPHPPPPHHFGGRGGGPPHPHGGPFWGGRGGGRGAGGVGSWFGFGGAPVVVEADVMPYEVYDEMQKGTTAAAAAPKKAQEEAAGCVVHGGVTCDVCGQSPIQGIRYKCTVRDNFDVCAVCFERDLQPYPMLKISTAGGEGCVVTPGAAVVRDLNDEDAGLQAAISESMAKVTLTSTASNGSVLSAAKQVTEEEVEDVYSESFTFVEAAHSPAAAPVMSAEQIARQAVEAQREAEQAALVRLWAKELSMLADMGFTDAAVLIPLLQANIEVPASQAGDNATHIVKAVEGMQSVVATLLLGQSGIRR